MSGQADPWDDSALLNAFDNAIKKYKKMHKKTQEEEENIPDEADPVITISAENVGDVNDSSCTEENRQTDSHDQENDKQTSHVVHTQENLESYTNSQGVDEYNELYKKYYELEEQRQKVLQQLQQSGAWSYQYLGEGYGPSGQWGTCSTHENQDFNQQASHPAVLSYCCPCVCPCLTTPSMPTCSLGGFSVSQNQSEITSDACTKGPDKAPPPLEDDATVKTAIGAAERAIASMNLKVSNINTNTQQGSSEAQMTQTISPEADLSVVLNAWYLAGFHTGKYLSEQSKAKGRRG